MSKPFAHGTIFLSHAAANKNLVEQVYGKLDSANTFYDIKTIAPGQKSIEAMRHGIDSAYVFALFHSPESNTAWVEFEKNLAEFNSIIHKHLKIVVFPINGSTYETLPAWMKGYMTGSSDFKTNDIVRTVQYIYEQAFFEVFPEERRSYPGREDLKREISLSIMRSAASSGKPLSALVLTGVEGMGRGTLASELIKDSYRGMRPGGPVFDLPPAGDGVDWHLKLLEDLNGPLSNDAIKMQIDAFNELDAYNQAKIISASLAHWGRLNQVVTIRNRWGMRDKGNKLRPWLFNLFEAIREFPEIKLVLLSERQLPREEIALLGNVMQFHLEELSNETIEYILSERINQRYLNPQRLSDLAKKINGHPAAANYTAYLINGGKSMDSLIATSDPISAFQDRILAGIFDSDLLTELQKKILKLLSWFPKLNIAVIAEAFPEFTKDDLTEAVWELTDFSLLDQSELGKYKSPTVVSSTYRRRGDEHDKEAFTRVSVIISKQFDNGKLDFDLIESLIIGIVAEGGGLPDELMKVLTPSRILPVVEKEYYDGIAALGPKFDQAKMHFEKCYSISKLVLRMQSADDTAENIFFYGADSSVRLGVLPEEMLDTMSRKGFSSAAYVKASYLYNTKRDFEEAARVLSKVVGKGGFRIRNVRLLARIYLRMGWFSHVLDTLGLVHENRLARDTGLVMMKIKALKGMKNHREANELLATLGGRDDDYGDVAIYKSALAVRTGNFEQALMYINDAKRAPKVNLAVLKFLQCACEVEAGNNESLAETCALARAMNRDSDAFQLQARAALVAGDWRSAEQNIKQVVRKDWFDLNVEYRIIELKSNDSANLNDPVLIKSLNERKEEILRQSARTIEGLRL